MDQTEPLPFDKGISSIKNEASCIETTDVGSELVLTGIDGAVRHANAYASVRPIYVLSLVGSLTVLVTADDTFHKDVSIKFLRIEDVCNGDIQRLFIPAIKFIKETLRLPNALVIVHCVAGISRSATIVLAYLMKEWKMGLKEAFEFVKQKRPIIEPNRGFWTQLEAYEASLLFRQQLPLTSTIK